MERVILKSTGALGDTVLMTSLVPRLREIDMEPVIAAKPFMFSLLDNLNIELINHDDLNGAGSIKVFDTSKYWNFHPESKPLHREFSKKEKSEMAALSEWMSYTLHFDYHLPIKCSSRDDVKISLTENEIVKARDYLKSISPDKPVVALPLFATTKNRNLPRKTIEGIVKGVSEFATPLFLPFADVKDFPAVYLSDKTPLRETASILYAVDEIAGADTGTTHLANAALQGTPDYQIERVNSNKNKILWLLGATHPKVTIYDGNRFITHTNRLGVCPLEIVCGAVGYSTTEDAQRRFGGMPFYLAGGKDKSACLYHDYSLSEVSRCMNEISAQEVVSNIHSHIRNLN
ncbi:MAG: hypothetical protein Q7S56_02480 [Nanoarchaeota archaeon]|nr:hypothetical protein [Nanoarchaeota archaeon]